MSQWFIRIAVWSLYLLSSLGIGYAQPSQSLVTEVNSQRLNGQQARDFFPLLQEELHMPVTVSLPKDSLAGIITITEGNRATSRVLDEVALQLGLGWGIANDNLIFFQINTSKPNSADDILSYAHLNRIHSFLRLWSAMSQDKRLNLEQAQFISVESLSNDAKSALSSLIKKEGLSIAAPKKGFLAISTGDLFNLAASQKTMEEGASETSQFRYYTGSFPQVNRIVSVENASGVYESVSKQVTKEQKISDSPLDLSVRAIDTKKLNIDTTLQTKIEPYLWQSLDSLVKKLGGDNNKKVRVDPRISSNAFFSSVENWSLKKLLDVIITSNNSTIESVGDVLLVKPFSTPLDDKETEMWTSYIVNNNRTDSANSPFIRENWVNGMLLDVDRTTEGQRKFVNRLAEDSTTKIKKEFIAQRDSTLRLSDGPTLRLSYYVPLGEIGSEPKKAPVFTLVQYANFPLYWDWEDSTDGLSESK